MLAVSEIVIASTIFLLIIYIEVKLLYTKHNIVK